MGSHPILCRLFKGPIVLVILILKYIYILKQNIQVEYIVRHYFALNICQHEYYKVGVEVVGARY